MTVTIRIRGTWFPFPRLLCRWRGHEPKTIHGGLLVRGITQVASIPPEWRAFVAAGGIVREEHTVCDRCGEWAWVYTAVERET